MWQKRIKFPWQDLIEEIENVSNENYQSKGVSYENLFKLFSLLMAIAVLSLPVQQCRTK